MPSETALHFAVIAPLLIGSLVWLALAIFTPGWLARIRRVWADWSGILIILMGLSVIGLGMATFLAGHRLTLRAVAIAAYDTAQLFTLNIDEERLNKDDAPLGWLAAASAALFAILFAFGVIATLFRDSLATFRLLIARRHVVVCGVGRTGRRIIEDLHRRDTRQLVVAIDIDPQLGDDLFLYTRGVITLMGSAAKEEVLRKARVSRATEVFVTTGSDEQNIECALAIADMSRSRSENTWEGLAGWFRRHQTRCFVHIVNRDLAEIFRAKSDDLEKSLPWIDIEVFSAAERTALKFLESMTRAVQLPGPDQVAHVVLIGFGRFAKSLALHLAELAHFPNNRRLRMTVADRDVSESSRPFLARHRRFCRHRDVPYGDGDDPWLFSPAYDEWAPPAATPTGTEAANAGIIDWVCNASFAEVDDPCDESFVRKISTAATDPHVWLAVIVAFDDDCKNFTTAERLKEIRDRLCVDGSERWPIFAWIPDRQELARLLNQQPPAAGVRAFGSCDDDAYYRDIAEAWTEQLPYLLNFAYGNAKRLAEFDDERSLASGVTVQYKALWKQFAHESHAAWQRKSAVMKPSNRSAAAHSVIKLAALGMRIAKGSKDASLDKRIDSHQLETLARMEHYRWVAERLLSGWSFGEPSDERKTRPQFRSYEELSDKDRDNDRTVVRTLEAICRWGDVRLEPLTCQREPHPKADVPSDSIPG